MFLKICAALLYAAAFSRMPAPDPATILVNMGYSPAVGPSEVVRVEIPLRWGAVYENYNALQRQGGFDLSPYKGKTCTRYTYEIPDLCARGNILVLDGEIIGGDVCSITLDGIMLPLERDKLCDWTNFWPTRRASPGVRQKNR